MSKRYTIKPGSITSLKDLELERQRLKLEILRTEEHIHRDYRKILDAFTLRNLSTSLLGEITHSATFLGKAFTFGKALMSKRKKKKKREVEQPESANGDQRIGISE